MNNIRKVDSLHCADCFAIALSNETFLIIPESSGELSGIIKKGENKMKNKKMLLGIIIAIMVMIGLIVFAYCKNNEESSLNNGKAH